MPFRKILISLNILFLFTCAAAQNKDNKSENDSVYIFTMDLSTKATPVKNQSKTGTCWCFATISFIESEMLQNGKEETDLSEMYVVRQTYPAKAEKYVRLMGMANFGEGGQAHDVFNEMKQHGLVPEEAYPGLNIGEQRHNHGELVNVLQSILRAVNEKKGGKVSPLWNQLVDAALDIYLGKNPESFSYKGETYTPITFMEKKVGINPADYIEFTSYSHHPYYQTFSLEIPDNWTSQEYYNVPLDDLLAIVDNSLKAGHSVLWDGDVSEKFFNQKKGYAVVPLKDWEDKTTAEREAKLSSPEPEKNITPEMRQASFNNFSATDDHLMHITGLAHDQNNTKYYYTKNSWGTDYKDKGYIYISEQYAKLNTLAIMVNKNAVPAEILKKCNIN